MGGHQYPHFAEEKSEALREVTCPRSVSQLAADLESKSQVGLTPKPMPPFPPYQQSPPQWGEAGPSLGGVLSAHVLFSTQGPCAADSPLSLQTMPCLPQVEPLGLCFLSHPFSGAVSSLQEARRTGQQSKPADFIVPPTPLRFFPATPLRQDSGEGSLARS